VRACLQEEPRAIFEAGGVAVCGPSLVRERWALLRDLQQSLSRLQLGWRVPWADTECAGACV
jgi:hypothetical protein